MTKLTCASAIAARCRHLAALGDLPPSAQRHSALRAIAVLCCVAEAGLRHRLIANSTAPDLTVPGFSGGSPLVHDLLADIAHAVAARVRGFTRQDTFSSAAWIHDHNLDALVIKSIKAKSDEAARHALLSAAATAAHKLTAHIDALKTQHADAIIARDAPALQTQWRQIRTNDLGWLLAHEHDGDPTRAQRVHRRLQAFQLYASLSSRLQERETTAAIDEGRELVPILAGRLGLTQPEIRALRQAAFLIDAVPFSSAAHEHAVRLLQAYRVPLHQWPGAGRPGQAEAWHGSPWLKSSHLSLIRIDYLGTDATVRDALDALRADLLEPLAASLAAGRVSLRYTSAFASLMDRANTALKPEQFRTAHLPAIRALLACLHTAIVGPRGPKAFAEAARLWHRRAACAAALRHEHHADRPGWPALCPPWVSRCGTYEVVALTTAQALVEEGNTHGHCVGGYYDACRSGNTQILSLRARGIPAVTAEILLEQGLAALKVGQFKGRNDQVPDDPDLHQAMRDFLRDLRTGAHPVNVAELRAYRRWAAEHARSGSDETLTLAHARAAFPLYRALLPRGTPAEFDAWVEGTGLKRGLGQALNTVADPPRALAA